MKDEIVEKPGVTDEQESIEEKMADKFCDFFHKNYRVPTHAVVGSRALAKIQAQHGVIESIRGLPILIDRQNPDYCGWAYVE